MEKFNENLKQFLEQITSLFPQQTETINSYYNFDIPSDKYLLEFYENCVDKGEDVSNKNEIVFSKDSKILNNVDFYEIWNSELLTEENKENIWKYLHTLYIFAYESIKERDIKIILKELKNLSVDRENIDDETKTLLNIVDTLTGKFKNTNDTTENTDSEDDNNDSFLPPNIFNGAIGDLAKEIVEEIDIEELNLNDPSKLLQDLLSGNFSEENDSSGVVNLVKNITGKIQDRLTNGGLNEADLLSEAQNLMKNLGGAGGNNPLGSIFSGLMNSNFMDNNDMDIEEQEIINQAQHIINNKGAVSNINPNSLKNQLDKKQTKDRLRKKLEDKRRLLELKKQQLQEKEQLVVEEENIDLDALAREIENINSNKTSSKTKRKKKRKSKKGVQTELTV